MFHIFPSAVGIGGFASFGAFVEKDLSQSLVSVDDGRERSRVGNFKGHIPFPFWFEGGDIADDTTAGVSGLADTDGEDVARDAEIFDADGESK